MRTILHCDLNNFFASVECKNKPWLNSVPVAVCGREDERKGIVIAKNDIAKSFGIKTGDTIGEARAKCRDVITVQTHYNEYKKYSQKVYEIYTRFTDMIEPFGIDECWLDVTGSQVGMGTGEEIAFKIKETVKDELGLRISVGVSFNKIFSKLGSDMKKPDAITVISHDDYKEKIWNLPAADMIGVGHATRKKLENYGIITIGELAHADEAFLKKILGENGIFLKQSALGKDLSPVCHQSYIREVKTIGNGTTCINDLTENDQVWRLLLNLSAEVCRRMREVDLSAFGVTISIKDSEFKTTEYQTTFYDPIRSSVKLADEGFKLFLKNYKWDNPVRSATIRAIHLQKSQDFIQENLFYNTVSSEKKERIEEVTDVLAKKYGDGVVVPLSLKMPLDIPDKSNRPGFFH